MDGAAFKSLKKGDKVRLLVKLGKSKHFIKGAILEILKDYKDFTSTNRIRGSYGEVKTLGGVHLTNYYNDIYPDGIELISEKEIKEMSKPSQNVTNIIGTDVFIKHVSEAARDIYIQKALTANPAAEIAVYSLNGVAAAVPVEVKFTIAASLGK